VTPSRAGSPRREALAHASRSGAEFVARDSRSRSLLDEAELPDRDGYRAIADEASARGGMSELRLEKRRRLLQIASWDLGGELPFERVGAALADLADACLGVGLRAVNAPDDLAIVALGKLGGRELNYVSDIDVIFVSRGDSAASTRAAEALLAALGGYFPEGRAYDIDVSLRPEGRSGVLVRSLRAALEHYERWAGAWEHQALIKARPAAGNIDVGEAFVADTRALVFPSDVTPQRIAAIRSMKERVEDHVIRGARRAKASERHDVKLGPGGIRDIEFCVQLFQLVHGGTDVDVRSPNTLTALAALVDGGYIADDDGAGLAIAYRWLRTVEHRLQLWQERRVHKLPQNERARMRLFGLRSEGSTPADASAARFDDIHSAILTDVRARFDKLFYRPLIEALSESGARLSSVALRDRLTVLGFRDADRAARVLGDLVAGTSRRAKVLRVLSPPLLRFLSSAPLPDVGLVAFLRLAESLGTRLDLLGAMRDNPPALASLARALGSGRLVGELLEHSPEGLQALAEPERMPALKTRTRLVREASASLGWREVEGRLDGLRRFKRREMLAIALSDLTGDADVMWIGRALADLADACFEAALEHIDSPPAVIGLGKLGGRELSYASDVDVMLVHGGDQPAAEKAAEELVRVIGEVTPEGQTFKIDLALRPEGKAGPLVRSLEGYEEYYSSWAKPWERMALIKARLVAGDVAVGEKLVELARAAAFPQSPPEEWLSEIKHLKARMERERMPRATDPRRHLKFGPGGLADIEFAAAMLQLRNGGRVRELQTTGTVAALEAARATNLLGDNETRRLTDAYEFLARLRNRLFFVSGRPVDVLPEKPETLEALGVAMGLRAQPRQELVDTYLRVTRRARRIAEPLIYD
jgi:glutamate-ammonia-ligase adenylyltransferase